MWPLQVRVCITEQLGVSLASRELVAAPPAATRCICIVAPRPRLTAAPSAPLPMQVT